MIISFASSKGGVGKSTVCAAVGARLAQRGEEVLISISIRTARSNAGAERRKWPGSRSRRSNATASRRNSARRPLQAKRDHILIDLAGTREATVLKAIARSDLVVIPAQASEPDLREALVVVSDIKDVAEEKGAPIPYRLASDQDVAVAHARHRLRL